MSLELFQVKDIYDISSTKAQMDVTLHQTLPLMLPPMPNSVVLCILKGKPVCLLTDEKKVTALKLQYG